MHLLKKRNINIRKATLKSLAGCDYCVTWIAEATGCCLGDGNINKDGNDGLLQLLKLNLHCCHLVCKAVIHDHLYPHDTGQVLLADHLPVFACNNKRSSDSNLMIFIAPKQQSSTTYRSCFLTRVEQTTVLTGHSQHDHLVASWGPLSCQQVQDHVHKSLAAIIEEISHLKWILSHAATLRFNTRMLFLHMSLSCSLCIK